jgi:PPM family protein phosphatase
MIRFSHGAATDVGHVRRVNEDSYLASPPLYAVADGMGGHGAGDVASALAIQVLAAYDRPPLSVGTVLAALDDANGAIIRGDQGSGMGTTVTGLALLETADGSRLMVFNVGDSRVYRLAGGEFSQVTEDHSEVQELVRMGAITREQARTHPRRNIVTRALGGLPDLRPDHWLLPPVTGDRYLVCSDGLHGELTDDVLRELLASGPPQQVAEALVRAANDAGGHDNVTALVIDVIVDSAADVTTIDTVVDSGADPRADTVDPTTAETGPLARLNL